MTDKELFGNSEQLDDNISRQAAIDALKNRWKKTRNYEGIGDDIAEECELYLKQVPSAQHWISCKERLPEVGRSVLLSVGSMYTAEGCLRDDGDWAQFRWTATLRKDRVDAWCPLPEPWKGEEE